MLGHHPSIALWCGHNEPGPVDNGPPGGRPTPRAPLRVAATLARPGWNKTVLDSSLRRALEKADRTRPVVAHSGVPAGDSHLWFGWYHGDERDLPEALASWPRLGRFVSEFGTRSVPDNDLLIDGDSWPDLDWDSLSRHHGFEPDVFSSRGLDPYEFPTAAAWRDASQEYQATVLRHHIETLRRLKYRPAGGFAMSGWWDGAPRLSSSVVDHTGRPKAALEAVRAACAPVIVVVERPPATVARGRRLRLAVHVVSDLREAIDELVVDAVARWQGGEHRQQWTGAVPADDCVRVGDLDLEVPDCDGPLHIEVSLEGRGITAANRYECEIRSGE